MANIEALGRSFEIGKDWLEIAGPCAAETSGQILTVARGLKDAGTPVLRAGLWKPRTTPQSWQGAGAEGLVWLEEARRQTGVAVCTEVMNERSLGEAMAARLDLVWIGSRNAQNYDLLDFVGREAGKKSVPVLLKRGMGSDVDEWLGAAEYLRRYDATIVLCERGIKGFPRDTRNVLDLQGAWLARQRSGLPVVVDVSHAAGRRDLIEPMALAVKAAGLDGVMVEVHPDPDAARTDAKQQIDLEAYYRLVRMLRQIPRL